MKKNICHECGIYTNNVEFCPLCLEGRLDESPEPLQPINSKEDCLQLAFIDAFSNDRDFGLKQYRNFIIDRPNYYNVILSAMQTFASQFPTGYSREQMEEAIRYAINIKDLWSAGQAGTVSADHEGELQALQKMEDLFTQALPLNK